MGTLHDDDAMQLSAPLSFLFSLPQLLLFRCRGFVPEDEGARVLVSSCLSRNELRTCECNLIYRQDPGERLSGGPISTSHLQPRGPKFLPALYMLNRIWVDSLRR